MAFALYYEARPFIEVLDLKRDNAFEKFQLFKRREGADGPEVLLFITGPGSINSAAAVAYICAKYPPGPEDFLVNTGICAGRTLAQKGQMYRIHTLCDLAANRWFYPDMFLISGTYPEESLATAPVPAKTMAGLPCTLADMEGAGVYQAAQMFFKQHQLLFFKAVFDLPDMDDTQGSGTLPEQVSNLLEKFASELLEALFKAHETCMSNMAGETAAFSEEEAAQSGILPGVCGQRQLWPGSCTTCCPRSGSPALWSGSQEQVRGTLGGKIHGHPPHKSGADPGISKGHQGPYHKESTHRYTDVFANSWSTSRKISCQVHKKARTFPEGYMP